MSSVSVIIPAYNEELRLLSTIDHAFSYLQTRGDPFEIIVVSDGSTDKTADLVRFISSTRSQVHLIEYKRNRGKGYATKLGVLAAKMELILCQDADGSTPIEELAKLESELGSANSIAIGSRNVPNARTKLDAKFHRKLIGGIYNSLVQMLLLPGLYDTQCGFKLFRKDDAQTIFRSSTEDGFSFDIEVLALARSSRLLIVEVPVDWHHVDASKVNLILTPASMFLDIFRIRAKVRRFRRLDSHITCAVQIR